MTRTFARSPRLGSLAALSTLALLAGCATEGRSFNPQAVEQIYPGQTTVEDVREMFGEPIRSTRNASGRSTWSYEFSETKIRSTSTLERVTCSILRVFGIPWCIPAPVSYESEHEIGHRLEIVFVEQVVDDFIYEKTDRPSRKVL